MRLLATFLAASAVFAAEIKIGQPLQLKDSVSISELTARPESFVNKRVQVKGKVTEVCQMMGCWMAIADPATNQSIRIQVNDGEMVFPKDSAGRTAIAEGKLARISRSKEQSIAQARHEAEEQGRKFNSASVKGPSVIYQIQGTGAILLDSAQ